MTGPQIRISQSLLLYCFVAASVAVVVSIMALDATLAQWLTSLSDDSRRLITRFVVACEWLFEFRVSVYFYGLLLLLAGAVAKAMKHPFASRSLLFIGLAHITARFLAGIIKPPFSRLRAFEALGTDGIHDTWFAAVGNSFPSGHAVHFWSLFFPMAVLFPRLCLPLAIVPVLVSAARVAVNDHYLSDVIASLGLAAFSAWMYRRAILKPHSELASMPGSAMP